MATAGTRDLPVLARWAVFQAGVLAMAAARVRPWPTAPVDVERIAPQLMAVAHILVPAVFAGPLFANRRRGVMVMAAVLPFAHLAAVLGDAPLASTFPPVAFTWLWMLVLGTWIRSGRSASSVAAIAAGWCVAGPLLMYLRLEYQPGANPSLIRGPLLECLREFPRPTGRGWTELTIALLLGGIAIIFPRSRQPIH